MTRRPLLLVLAATAVAGAAIAYVTLREPPAVDIPRDPARRTASTDAACGRFARSLPDDLDSLERRRTSPATPAGFAAYGEPPVVVRCGVPVRTRYEPGDQLIVINGVEWDVDELADGSLRCSLPRALVNVEVSIPRGYTAERLALLTEAVNQAQPL